MSTPRRPAIPKTVFVAGTRRNAGKTLVSEFLLRSLPGAGAIKLTCCRPGRACPRDRPCGVCGALIGPFAIIRDQQILAQRGKDTARLLAAATGKVVWLQSREGALREAMVTAITHFTAAPVVVVEGNAAFQAAKPDLGVLVVGPGVQSAKSSVRVALPMVDVVVRNVRPSFSKPAQVEGLGEDVVTFSFDAANPGDDPSADAFVRWVRQRLRLGSEVPGLGAN